MKHHERPLYGLLAIVSMLGAIAAPAAVFDPPVRVTNDPGYSDTEVDGGRNAWSSRDSLLVVWSDDRHGNAEILYRERTGGAWSAVERLTTDPGASRHPAVGCTESGEVRVVWEDDRSGRREIYATRRLPGSAWSPDTCLTCDAHESARPALDQPAGNLVWEETSDGNREIYHALWETDGSWGARTRVSVSEGVSAYASVASPGSWTGAGDAVLVAWEDDRDGNREIYARIFDGMNWMAETRLTHDSGDSRHPSAWMKWNTCTDAIFLRTGVAWEDDRASTRDIFMIVGDSGWWGSPSPLVTTPSVSRHPTVATVYTWVPYIFGYTWCPHMVVAWEEDDRPNGESTVLYLDPGTPDLPVEVSPGGAGAFSSVPTLASWHKWSQPDPARGMECVWTDTRDGNREVYAAGFSEPVATGVESASLPPGDAALGLARPSPFSASTRVEVSIRAPAKIELRVHNAAGQRVCTLASGVFAAGNHPFVWDGRDDSGRPSAAGSYFLRLLRDGATETRKVVRIP
ncbi:MAG: FlgD immunoglobulin-like domain containing protein [Gemmatimonadota bacterium]|nr:FlgD immunoglobulin-like domain containing protein [Gemmatimonadota bacterium]